MIRHLGDTLSEFPGPANQTRCFVHTINLIVKSILKPFDSRKAKDIKAFSDVVQALIDPAEDLEQAPGDGEEKDDNSNEGADEREEESPDNEFDKSLKPIMSMLLKVRLCLIEFDPWVGLTTSIEYSYAELHLDSRTRQPPFSQHGTRCFLRMSSPIV